MKNNWVRWKQKSIYYFGYMLKANFRHAENLEVNGGENESASEVSKDYWE